MICGTKWLMSSVILDVFSRIPIPAASPPITQLPSTGYLPSNRGYQQAADICILLCRTHRKSFPVSYRFYQLNIGSFAGEYRLFTISSQFSGFGIGRQDIGRPGEHFVKHRKHGLVRHQSFPQRFYPAHLRHTTGQILCKHKLPRIKLEHTVYRHTVGRKQ